MAPIHFLNQCWLFIKCVLWHLPECNCTRNYLIRNMRSEITLLEFLPHLPGTKELRRRVLLVCLFHEGWYHNVISRAPNFYDTSRFLIFRFCGSVLPWLRHQMATFSALLARSPVNSPHKGQWRGALMFSLIGVWTNAWVNNRDAGDLRRHRADYDVTIDKSHIAHRGKGCLCDRMSLINHILMILSWDLVFYTS